MTVQIEVRCDYCRGSNISIPLNAGEETLADCGDCGAEVGTVADLKTQMSLHLLGRNIPDDRQPAFSWYDQHPHAERSRRGRPMLRLVSSGRRR
jgi:hypothetical protein